MDRPYTFRLGAVLRYRQRREDECRRRVAEQLRRLGRIKHELRLLESALGDQMEQIRAAQLQSTLDVSLARGLRGYMLCLERRRADVLDALRRVESDLGREQEALTHAAREVKALEKLRDRQEARAAERDRRRLIADEDEIARDVCLRNALAEGVHS